jgi:hypothetical protein
MPAGQAQRSCPEGGPGPLMQIAGEEALGFGPEPGARAKRRVWARPRCAGLDASAPLQRRGEVLHQHAAGPRLKDRGAGDQLIMIDRLN